MAPCAWATMASQRDPRYLSLSSAFRPHAPIDDSKLFAGRTQELAQIIDCINQIGRHGLLFGERGVGKTSLARVFKSFLGHGSSVGEGTQTAILVPYVTCDGSDGYATVWHKVFQRVAGDGEAYAVHLNPRGSPSSYRRVDPDNTSLGVQERTARVTWVEGSVGLNHAGYRASKHAYRPPACSAYHPYGDGVEVSEGTAHGNGQLPGFNFVRVGQAQRLCVGHFVRVHAQKG